MLTHENVVSAVAAVTMQLGEHRPVSSDVMMSFLPLAHMLERCCEVRLSLIFPTPANEFVFSMGCSSRGEAWVTTVVT